MTKKFVEFEIVEQKQIDASKVQRIDANLPLESILKPERLSLVAEDEQIIISMLHQGLTKKAICAELNISEHNMFKYLKQNPLFNKQYKEAAAVGYDALADSLLTINQTEPDVLRARVVSDNIKWLLARRKPETYGDKLEVNMNATVDIAGALAEARGRVSESRVGSMVSNSPNETHEAIKAAEDNLTDKNYDDIFS